MKDKGDFMIIDVHAHFSSFYTMEEALEAMDRCGIDKIYLSNPNSPGGYYPSKEQVDLHNAQITVFSKAHPDRVRYVPFVNPIYTNTVDVLKKAVYEDNAKAIKLWVATTCDSHHVDKVAEFSIEHDLPIIIHTFHKYGGSQLPDETTGIHVANLARRYPETKLVMAHMGGDAYHGIKYIRNLKNVWTDVSGSNFRNGEIEYSLKLLGEDRILFGSDAMCGINFHTNVGKITEMNVSDEIKEKIFWKNAAKLFKEEL